MLDLPWFNVEEGIQMFREIGMLESFMTYSPKLGRVLKPYLLPILWEISLWGQPQYPWRALWMHFLFRPHITVGTAVTALENLNAMGVIGSMGVRGQVVPLIHQRQSRCGCCNGQQSQSSNQNSLTHADLWHWLVDHCVPTSEIGSLPNSYLICISRKVLGQVNKSLVWIIKTELWSFNQFPVYRPRNPWMKGRLELLEEGPWYTTKNL